MPGATWGRRGRAGGKVGPRTSGNGQLRRGQSRRLAGRGGRGGSQKEGLVLPAVCEGTGGPFAPVGQRSEGRFTSCRDSARCSGPGGRARRRELREPGWRALAEEEREEGKKNISKSEK